MGKSSYSSSSDVASENKHEQKLQAILLADSFMTTFRPISLDTSTPKVLCPLNNVTMLDYSIEFLAGSGVEELFVFCVTGGDTVESYVEKSGWTSSIKVQCVKDTSVTNAGDALRELDKLGLIVSDPFILMSGDVVTNVDIAPILREHKERHKKDSSAIMTVLLKRVGAWQETSTSSSFSSATPAPIATHPKRLNGTMEYDGMKHSLTNPPLTTTHVNPPTASNPTFRVSSLRSLNEDLVVALADPSTSQDSSARRMLLYDSNPNSATVAIPTSFFESHSQIQVCSDSSDTGIYICSPDVLVRFSDEFDYLFVSKFISNSVAEEEVGLQNKIYAYTLKSSEYAARIHDPRTYHAVSRDLLRRWCYPVVPDNLPSGYEKVYRYVMERNMVYRERKKGGTKVGRSTVVEGPGMIGSGCFVGELCHIKGTVIGNDCNISDHVSLLDSHLWGNVTVEKNASVSQSILCNDCIIKTGAVVPKGCIIGRGCVIGENVKLPEFTRITLYSNKEVDVDEDDLDEEEEEEDDEDLETINEDELDALEAEESSVDSDKDHSVKGIEFSNSGIVEVMHSDHDIVGPDGFGRLWIPGENDMDFNDDYDEEGNDDENNQVEVSSVNSHPYLRLIPARVFERVKQQSIGYDPGPLLKKRKAMQEECDDDYVSDDEHSDIHGSDDDADRGEQQQISTMISSSNLNENGAFITGRQRGIDVVKELKCICLEHDIYTPIENLAIELNSFKFSQNATFSDCVTGATLAILERINITKAMSAVKLVSSFKAELAHWGGLFKKLCHSTSEEQSIILALEMAAIGGGIVGEVLSAEPAFRFILQTLHDEDIISEDSILDWANLRREEDSNTLRGKLFLQKHTQDFLEWLDDDDSTSGQEDSEDEDETDDD